MIEIQNATVYKCEHCNYQDTMKARLLSHENKCLSEQLKTAKNRDKQEIYNILDVDLINTKIRNFLKKYNLPVSTELEYCSLNIGDSLYVDLVLEKSIRGIFDKSKFKIYNEIIAMRYTKEHLSALFNEKLKEIEVKIVLKEAELGILLDKRKDIVLESIKDCLKWK